VWVCVKVGVGIGVGVGAVHDINSDSLGISPFGLLVSPHNSINLVGIVGKVHRLV
jgi:uncharacterized membrane protein SpoIIM required for sporulation